MKKGMKKKNAMQNGTYIFISQTSQYRTQYNKCQPEPWEQKAFSKAIINKR